jgi:predicted KAP-like P-loop ATPase
VPGDHPIEKRAEDQLDRGRFVDGLVQGLRGLDTSRGAVVAILGPWGAGKSSVLNMVKEGLSKAPTVLTVEFNPWLFSGTEELLGRFFGELARQLRLKDSKAQGIAQLFDDYGGTLSALKWVPVAGPWLDRGWSVGKLFVGHRLRKMAKSNSLAAQQEKLTRALTDRAEPTVVVIDDIDRLQAQEVRDVLRLVRLTGSFPNVIYLLAFDRERIERLLDHEDVDGRAYLEKIVEYVYDLPAASPPALQRVLTSGLDAVTARFPAGPFQTDRWPDVFVQGMLPLFKTLRDVKRYHSVLPAALATIGDEVALVDVLALEAVRVLFPNVYQQLSKMADLLTGVHSLQSDRAASAQRLQALLDEGPEDAVRRAGLEALLRQLFPACDQYFGGSHYNEVWAASWGRDRRVANPAVLQYYLNRVLDPGTAPASLVAAAFMALTDETQLRQVLQGVDETTLENLLERMESYEEDFPPEAAEPASVVLLDLLTRLRHPNTRGPFELPPDFRVTRVVLRLLRRADGADLVDIVDRVGRRVQTMNARMQLLVLVGDMPNAGQKLIPVKEYERLLGELSCEIRHAAAAQLAVERTPLRLLGLAVEQDPEDRTDLDQQLQDPTLALALLRDALGYVQSRSIGSVTVHREPILRWDELIAIYGDEQSLETAQGTIRGHGDLSQEDDALLALAGRYREGWRPSPLRTATPRPRPLAMNSRNSPYDLLSVSGDGAPDLALRTLASYEIDQVRAEQVSLRTQLVIDAVCTKLGESELAPMLAGLGLDGMSGDWSWGLDSTYDHNNLAVQFRADQVITGPPFRISVTCSVLMPVPQVAGTGRVVVDILVDRTAQSTDGPADVSPHALLTLEQVRDMFVWALGAAAKVGGLLPSIVDDCALPSAGVEMHIAGRMAQSDRQASNIEDMINLEPLGARPGSGSVQPGQFAVPGSAPVDTSEVRQELIVQAIRHIGGNWGFLTAGQWQPGAQK